jgi:hypothetical protein
MKDRIGNTIEQGDKVLVSLPEKQVFGFVSDISESALIAPSRGGRGALQKQAGRVLVSCVFALPVDEEYGLVAQVVKVYDSDKHEPATPPN